MRHAPLLRIALLTLLPLAAAHAATKAFEVDTNHTSIGFTAGTFLFDVQGRFTRYKVQISGDPDTGADAKVRLEIDAASIDTGNKSRDKHLQSPDFFDVGKYPKIVFTSSKVAKEGSKVVIDGTLEMHGVKKDLRLSFEGVTGQNGAGVTEHAYKAELPLNRKDFGIGAESVAAKISLKDQVKLSLLLAGFFEEPKAKK
jgi:polyisoprenoid-binding protein YceI